MGNIVGEIAGKVSGEGICADSNAGETHAITAVWVINGSRAAFPCELRLCKANFCCIAPFSVTESFDSKLFARVGNSKPVSTGLADLGLTDQVGSVCTILKSTDHVMQKFFILFSTSRRVPCRNYPTM